MTTSQLARSLAGDLRKNPTDAEKILWEELRKRKFLGLRFLFQHPVFYKEGNQKKFFIADFYCHELRLIIEVDGDVHKDQAEYDQIRTDILECKHISVVRFSNKEIQLNLKSVLADLKNKAILIKETA